MTVNTSLSNALSSMHEAFPKVKILFQFASNDYDVFAHQISSQVLDSITLSNQDTKTRENLMATASSSNVNYEQEKSVFPWSNKHGFCKKHKNKDENEGVKKSHRSKVKKSSVE